ncbi:FlgK family flagellar hook-associated protein [Salinisphaera sp. RV14]|uniref:FlgK family flagellar hook-associated protein n=1 Tax=unclassified Salinisphaera TaxID=2649847 RepID=UPI003F87757B
MAGLSGVLGTDLSGLEAYRSALNAISENVSNANTTGYAKRTAALATRYEGVDQAAGTGVNVTGINRSVSQFANTRLRAANASQGQADSLVNALTNLQSNFSSSGGISSSLNQFFSDAKAVGSNPSDIPTRQTLIADGQQLTGTFNTLSQSVSGSISSLSQQGANLTQQANQIVQNLAQINQSLRNRSGQNTNALLDQQSAALQKLSALVGVNVIRHANGTVRLGVRGHVLLNGSGAKAMQFIDLPGQAPVVQLSDGHTIPSGALTGQIGGVLKAQTQASQQLQQVNRFAAITASVINGQQAQGLNLNGNQGSPLMTLPTPSIVPQSSNSGSETLSATLNDPTQLPSNGGPFQLTYNGSNWQATNQVSGKTQNVGSGSALNFDGIQVAVSGSATSGDSFTIDPVNGAAANIQMTTADPKAIAAAAPYVGEAGTYGATGALNNNNAGNGTVSAGHTTTSLPLGAAMVGSSYFGQSLQVKFTSSSNYKVVQPSTGTTVSTGTFSPSSGGAVDINYPGASPAPYWQMNIQGTPAAGDSFTLSPGGTQSGENADALGALQSAATVQGASLTDAWSQVTAQVGTSVQAAQNSQANAKASVQSAQQAQSAVSGVSLDQQAGDIQRFSQAYQASAKAISTVNQLFQTLLSAT